jgi:hypothetical protein
MADGIDSKREAGKPPKLFASKTHDLPGALVLGND